MLGFENENGIYHPHIKFSLKNNFGKNIKKI